MYMCAHTIEMLQSEMDTQYCCGDRWEEDLTVILYVWVLTSAHTNYPKDYTKTFWLS